MICPDFVQASVKAERTYGPLELLGRIARGDLDQMVAEIIEQQVVEALYAHVPPDQLEALRLNDVDPEPVQLPGPVSANPRS